MGYAVFDVFSSSFFLGLGSVQCAELAYTLRLRLGPELYLVVSCIRFRVRVCAVCFPAGVTRMHGSK